MVLLGSEVRTWSAMNSSPRFHLATLKSVSPNQAFPSLVLQHHFPFDMWLSRWTYICWFASSAAIASYTYFLVSLCYDFME
jgi:hypothetical protein